MLFPSPRPPSSLPPFSFPFSHLQCWSLVNNFSALFSVTLHYATKKRAGVNRKSLETVLWVTATATATQSPLLGGASWTAAWTQYVRGSPERDYVSWLVCWQQSVRFDGKMERLKNIHEAKDARVHALGSTWMPLVTGKRRRGGADKGIFHVVRCLVTSAGNFKCSIYVEHLGYFTVIRLVFKKKQTAQTIEKYYSRDQNVKNDWQLVRELNGNQLVAVTCLGFYRSVTHAGKKRFWLQKLVILAT